MNDICYDITPTLDNSAGYREKHFIIAWQMHNWPKSKLP